MNLAEYQKRYGIQRIDFNKVHRSGLEETYANDKMICPYCQSEIEYEGEETEDVIKGTPYQCFNCGKWFYAEGEVTIDVTCTPMEDAVIDNRLHIERGYEHIDKCEEKGMDFPEKAYGFVEWENYYNWERPLRENEEKNGKC